MTLSPPEGVRPLWQDAARRPPAGGVLARVGAIEARLACDAFEVETAQALRAAVFFGGSPSQPSHDADRFDLAADHLILIDTAGEGPLAERVVGTTRLLGGAAGDNADGFYSSTEFDLVPLIGRNLGQRFLEVGRSCVRPDFRMRGGADALWAGIWAYARLTGADAMIGCASLPGTVPAAQAQALSYLTHRHRAEGRWAVRAHAARFREMDLVPAEAVDPRLARAGLPPLVRGYLRLGAGVGEGCVVDEAFGTTDVFVILPAVAIGGRYASQYGSPRAA